jgi:hypothetical protein
MNGVNEQDEEKIMPKNRLFLKTSGILVLALLALSAMAGAQVWTAVASSGAIRDTSINVYAASDAALFFRSNATGNIWATYNVTNPRDISSPAWTTLEFTARNSGSSLGSYATASLYRVPRGSGSSLAVCTAITPSGGVLTTSTCTFSSSIIDFTNNSYYVVVSLGRDNTAQTETAYSLRIF